VYGPSVLCVSYTFLTAPALRSDHNVAHDREETENRPLSHRLHLRMIQHENLLRPGFGFRLQLLRHDRGGKERDSVAGSGMC